MRWYWHVVALTLVVGGTLVSAVIGWPVIGLLGVGAWFALWYGVVRPRVIELDDAEDGETYLPDDAAFARQSSPHAT